MSEPQTQPKKPNILIVDDKPENLRLLANTLTQEGYDVRGVINGLMALRVAKSVRPNLILLDIMMPDLNGYQVCQKLKAHPKTKDIPIIFLSANTDVDKKVNAFAVGGVDYINKPFQIDEVLARIKNQLDLQAAQAQVQQLNAELEKRIQERTAQLEATNQELQQEIVERREITKLLQKSEERLESILNYLEEVVWSADVETRQLVFINPAAQKVYGRPISELLNNSHPRLEVVYPEDRQRVEKLLQQQNSIDLEYRIVKPNGEVRWLWERSRVIYNDQNIPIRLDGIIHDITERKRFEEQLTYEALHDALTGLPNRVLLMKRIEQALKRARCQKDYLFAVLFLDLDRFKIVNDSLGHLVGDQLLIAVARLLKGCLRSNDMVARFGGDEFIIFLAEIRTLEDATRIAERIKTKLMSPFQLKNHKVFTGASIGIVVGSKNYQQSSEILRDADIAMYRSKADGKARYTVFDRTMYIESLKLLELENDLHNALNRQEFVLHYQPIVCLRTGQLKGFEALLRWHHPVRGLVFPGEFIHIAEDTGLIIPIGEWILTEACKQLRTWQRQFANADQLKISVNLASKQIREPNFLARLEQILEITNFKTNCLRLEITESMLMDSGDKTINLLQQLRTKNIQLSIDDFGTGYSSLSYLHRFPVNSLKIDRSFVSGMTTEKENQAIIRTIVTLAHTLSMDVIAEGVETVEQLKQLRTLGCEMGQGYFFSRPQDAQSAVKLLQTNGKGVFWHDGALAARSVS